MSFHVLGPAFMQTFLSFILELALFDAIQTRLGAKLLIVCPLLALLVAYALCAQVPALGGREVVVFGGALAALALATCTHAYLATRRARGT